MKSTKPIMKAAAWAANILPDGIKRIIYKIPFLSKFIRRSLNAAAPDGLTEVEIASGPAKGLFMALNLHEEKDYWLGTYEPDLQAAAQILIHPGNTVYDVGANIGYISLISANLVGETGKVFSFEALPTNIERLIHNVEQNQLSNRVYINHAAVVDKKDSVTFLTHTSGAMGKAQGSAGRDEKYTNTITVSGISLDSFIFKCSNPPPDLVKMDIEGGEGNALIGAKKMLVKNKPILLIELHGEEAARQVWDILIAYDYHIHALEHGYPRVKSVSDLDWKAYIVALQEGQSALLT